MNRSAHIFSRGILARKMGKPRSNCNKRDFFANFTPTRPFEHHIKDESKSTFGKLLKIVVKNRAVSHLHGNEA